MTIELFGFQNFPRFVASTQQITHSSGEQSSTSFYSRTELNWREETKKSSNIFICLQIAGSIQIHGTKERKRKEKHLNLKTKNDNFRAWRTWCPWCPRDARRSSTTTSARDRRPPTASACPTWARAVSAAAATALTPRRCRLQSESKPVVSRQDHLGSVRRQHNVRWQYLTQIKDWLFLSSLTFFLPLQAQQVVSGTSATTYKLMGLLFYG